MRETIGSQLHGLEVDRSTNDHSRQNATLRDAVPERTQQTDLYVWGVPIHAIAYAK